MILDIDRFVRLEEPFWKELEDLLSRLGARPEGRLTLEEAERLEYLYSRAVVGLNRVEHGAPGSELLSYLERLVARAYGEIYQSRRFASATRVRAEIGKFFIHFPQVFRKHAALFALSLMLTIAGAFLGGIAVLVDPVATDVLLPMDYLKNPQRRIAHEQRQPTPTADPNYASAFSGFLMTHNIRVSLFALLLGVTLGIGTGLELFLNGLLLGAVVARYVGEGAGAFVAGWLLPHGAFEIPAMLIAGQAGFLIAQCLLRGGVQPRWLRLRAAVPDVLTLAGGLSCMLVWAGIVEAFFSQHHAPEIHYSLKIAFGAAELLALGFYLGRVGRHAPELAAQPVRANAV